MNILYKTAFKAFFFFALLLSLAGANAQQIYLHDFGTASSFLYPYNEQPAIGMMNANLSGSSWTNNIGSWTRGNGQAGNALQLSLNSTTANNYYELKFNVAPGFSVRIDAFDFWTRRSGSGPTNWQMSINGVNVGSGPTSGSGAAIGITNISVPPIGLTGTVTVRLSVTGATSNTGNLRLDNFTLYGAVTSLCAAATVTNFSPASGPAGTTITYTGNDFNNVTGVTFDGIPATSFSVVSNTTLTAVVPAGVTAGAMALQTTSCAVQIPTAFTFLETLCGNVDVYISEIFDASRFDGGVVELYNPTGADISFDGRYVLEGYNNIGDASPRGGTGYTITLVGAIAAHSTLLIQSGTNGVVCDPLPYSTGNNIGGINENDQLKLRKNTQVIDDARCPNYVGYTVKRNPPAVAPNINYSAADWSITAQGGEVCTDLGRHTENLAPVTAPTVTNPANVAVCEGANATFTVSVTPSTGLTYQWKTVNAAGNWVNVTNSGTISGATTPTLTLNNVTAALDKTQYYCYITSASCIIYSNAAQLTVGGALAVPTVTVTPATCTTGGQAVVTNPTGTGFTYSLSGGSFGSSPSFTNLTAGSYTIVAKNAAGCTSAPFNFTISASAGAPAVPTLSATQPNCTTSTGTITVTNPQAGLQYQLDSGTLQAGTTFTNVGPGSHTITVQNATGCTNSASITINAAPALPVAPTLTATQPTCTTSTGTITVTNPQAGLQYQLDTGAFQSADTFSNVTAGSHTITVQNAAGCLNSASITINAAPATPASPMVLPTQPTCTTPGSITVTNPQAGLQYLLDGGTPQSSPVFTNVSAGNHTVTVQNAAGCINSTSILINAAPGAPATPTLTATQPTCTTATGTITVTNPQAGLQYQLDSGALQSTATFTSVAPGSHTITVQNAAGCTNSASITINAAPTAPVAPVLSAVQPTCTTAGSITVTNPQAGLQYQLDTGTFQSTATFTNVAPGSHTVTVQTAAGCTNSATITINAAPSAPTAPVLSAVQPTCTTPGSITVTNPQAGMDYQLDSGSFQSAATFTNVSSGSHTVTVRDSGGCTNAGTITINPTPTIPRPVFAYIQPTCTVSTGTVTVTSPVGAGYQYSLNGGTYQTSPVFSGLVPNTYSITALAPGGCSSVGAATVLPIPNAPATPVTTEVQPGCTVATGQITITAPVGSGYLYAINGGTFQSSRVFSGLAAGSYTITVRNPRGCETTGTPIIINTAPATPATPVLTAVQPQCGDTTGSLTVTSPTGSGINYSVNGGSFLPAVTYNNLTPGLYSVVAQNASGCLSATATIRINTPPVTPSIPLISAVQPTCAAPYGTITVSSPTGPGYTYSIDGTTFQSGLQFTNLAAAGYNVTVKNAAGCTAVSQMLFIDAAPAPAPAPGTITGGNSVCADATLQLANTVTGGVWSISNDRIATIDATGLVTPVRPGTVTVYYTVGTVCTAQTQQTVTVNGLPNITIKDLYLCVDTKTQAVLAPKTLSSGLPDAGYTFVWEKGGTALPDTTASIQVNEPGTYTVTATATATGCTASGTATVGVSSIALATAEVGEDFHRNQAVTITVTGGSGDYVFSMDNGAFQTSPVFTGVSQGEHTVSVYDNNGCGKIELEVFVLDYPRFFTANNDGANDIWKIDGLANQRDAIVYIYDRYGKLISALRPASNQGWDGTLNGHPLPATDYWFSVMYTSSNGVRKEFRAHFSLLR